MKLSRDLARLALLLAASMLAALNIAHAGTQWSGIKGRAWLDDHVYALAPSLTNSIGRPPLYSSNYVTVRSPIKTTIRVYAAKSGRLVRTVNTDDSGRFATLLQPGLYRLEPAIIWDGNILGPSNAVTMDLNHIVQTAPAQMVYVGGLRYAQVTVVYHTIWPRWYPIRMIPSRQTRIPLVPSPVGTTPPPQAGAIAILTRSPSPPLPPTPVLPQDSPRWLLPLPPLPSQR